MTTEPHWLICADTGGTFTDCVAIGPGGAFRRAKVLSTGAVRARLRLDQDGPRIDPQRWPLRDIDPAGFLAEPAGRPDLRARIAGLRGDRLVLDAPWPGAGESLIDLSTGEPAPVLAARLVTGTPAGRPLPPATLRLATTRGTNALLTRSLTPAALFITRGFADLPAIGDQRRPDLFALDIDAHPERRGALHAATVEVDGRLDASGRELRAVDAESVREAAERLAAGGLRAAAVCLLHAWADDRHERLVEDLLRQSGFTHVSRSSALAPRLGLLARVRTTLVNAALSGPLEEFLLGTAGAFRSSPRSGVLVMTSAAGLVPAPRFEPKDSLLSGPAAGVIGAAAAGARCGIRALISFDMGGTSTDVARIDDAASGRIDTTHAHSVGGATLLAPAVNVESVAAGGGSVCGIDPADGGLAVGPRSAGASPGPACYGAGGPLTVTDVNLLCGRIDPARFQVPVDPAPAREALRGLHAALRDASHAPRHDDSLLDDLLAIANDRMASAIRRISVRQGYDPATFTLVAFGGAGPQHACAVAEALGMTRALVPADGSLLSAAGLSIARPQRRAAAQVLAPLVDVAPGLEELFGRLARQADAELARDGVSGPTRVVARTASLRYAGQHHALELDAAPGADLAAAFESRSREVFGHHIAGRAVEVESVAVVCEAGGPAGDPWTAGVGPAHDEGPAPAALPPAPARFAGRWVQTPRVARESLRAGERVTGPALIVEDRSVTVVEPGWAASSLPTGDLLLERSAPVCSPAAAAPRELLTGRLNALGEEMGEQLRRTALSTNVKERLDYSCALLDAEGRLIVSAPHVPVHLGALGLCVRRLVRALPLGPGDVAVTNHPAFGGSHLPDVTLVAPAHDASGRLLGYAACRAHHAEIGGVRPGSMPPHAATLAEEGVVIAPRLLTRAGVGDEAGLRDLLLAGPFPTRAVEENMADLAAQAAALRRGVRGLRDAAEAWSAQALADAMNAMRHAAHRRLSEALRALDGAELRGVERLDDGRELHALLRARDGRITIDLSGSPPTHPGNLNAPLAVVHSAVAYVMRVLLGPASAAGAVPLNDGLLEPVEIIAPPGMLNPPFDEEASRCPAVAAGNVETSQRLVNLLVRTLGLAADSQGTMNNVIFGNERFGYYETLCGGAGAGPGFAGASAVHTHMTNTAITDPELLEHRYPVRLDAFEIRRGSGGAGAHAGGDGARRRFTFLASVSLSLITQHRIEGPAGLQGGKPGKPGSQTIIHADGSAQTLAPSDTAELPPGASLIIETPGGGGWGSS